MAFCTSDGFMIFCMAGSIRWNSSATTNSGQIVDRSLSACSDTNASRSAGAVS